jgi:hypothetical protein
LFGATAISGCTGGGAIVFVGGRVDTAVVEVVAVFPLEFSVVSLLLRNAALLPVSRVAAHPVMTSSHTPAENIIILSIVIVFLLFELK